jgi:Tol biopolymer transport system component
VNTYDVALTDLVTGRTRVLDSVQGHGAYAEPGQVDGRYAVWAGCPDNFCTIYRYDLRSGRRIRVPGDYAHVVFAPSVTANGDIYYGRSLAYCGAQVRVMHYRPGTPPQVIASLATGFDFRFSTTDGRRVLFDRVNCKHGNFDLYSVRISR